MSALERRTVTLQNSQKWKMNGKCGEENRMQYGHRANTVQASLTAIIPPLTKVSYAHTISKHIVSEV